MTGLRGYGGRHRRQWTIAEWSGGSAPVLLRLAKTPANRTRLVLMTTGPDKRPEVFPSIQLPSCIVNDGWWLVADSPEAAAKPRPPIDRWSGASIAKRLQRKPS